MAIQKLPLAAVQQVRQYIQTTLAVVDSDVQSQTWLGLDDTEDVPEPESIDDLGGIFAFGGLSPEELMPSMGRWMVSTVNPAAAIFKLPGLQLKPDFRLVSYLYRADKDGIGVVRAVPVDHSSTAQLEDGLVDSTSISHLPQPMGALLDFMEAMEGDRTPVSFLVASILRRELLEFGAIEDRCNWSHHRLIDAIPAQASWKWGIPQPPDFAPKVKILPDGQAAVEFFTCRVRKPIAIFRHLDLYPPGQYLSKSQDKAIAIPMR
jgi:hypothetical protein